jgi:hypothetical protein
VATGVKPSSGTASRSAAGSSDGRASARRRESSAVFYGQGPGASAHVGIVVQVLPTGEIVTVEGNYNGRVTRVGPFKPSAPVGEAAPIYGYAQPPAPRGEGAST